MSTDRLTCRSALMTHSVLVAGDSASPEAGGILTTDGYCYVG